jgi:hypothetical protein
VHLQGALICFQNGGIPGKARASISVPFQETAMEKVEKTVQFEIEKETKHTVKFSEVPEAGQAPIIGTLYVQKWFAGDATKIEVTVRK